MSSIFELFCFFLAFFTITRHTDNQANIMKQTITIEIEDSTVLQLLRNLAAMNLIKFTTAPPSQDDLITARLNKIYNELNSSLEPCYISAQAEVLESEDW